MLQDTKKHVFPGGEPDIKSLALYETWTDFSIGSIVCHAIGLCEAGFSAAARLPPLTRRLTIYNRRRSHRSSCKIRPCSLHSLWEKKRGNGKSFFKRFFLSPLAGKVPPGHTEKSISVLYSGSYFQTAAFPAVSAAKISPFRKRRTCIGAGSFPTVVCEPSGRTLTINPLWSPA